MYRIQEDYFTKDFGSFEDAANESARKAVIDIVKCGLWFAVALISTKKAVSRFGDAMTHGVDTEWLVYMHENSIKMK